MVVLFSLNAKYNLESSTGGMTGNQLISVYIVREFKGVVCYYRGNKYFSFFRCCFFFFLGFVTLNHFAQNWFQGTKG